MDLATLAFARRPAAVAVAFVALWICASCGSGSTATSSSSEVSAPLITTQPSSQSVNSGQTATFTVVATGTAPISYQWTKAGANISGATSAGYTTPATAFTDNGSQFQVKVSNSAGSVTSSTATLTINVAPSIVTQPSSQTVAVGQAATFTVAASGTAPLTYQWQKGGVSISGATSASYTTPAAALTDNGSQLQVTVSNTLGSVTSNTATLSVSSSPAIGTQPANQTVTTGQAATFAVAAFGTPPLNYQWQREASISRAQRRPAIPHRPRFPLTVVRNLRLPSPTRPEVSPAPRQL